MTCHSCVKLSHQDAQISIERYGRLLQTMEAQHILTGGMRKIATNSAFHYGLRLCKVFETTFKRSDLPERINHDRCSCGPEDQSIGRPMVIELTPRAITDPKIAYCLGQCGF